MGDVLEMPELAVVSSKGQLVIPSDIRKNMKIKEGSVLAVSSAGKNLLVLKKMDNPIDKKDMETIKGLEKAWDEYDKGKFVTMGKDDFLKELRKW